MLQQAMQEIEALTKQGLEIKTINMNCGRRLFVIGGKELEDRSPRPTPVEFHTLSSMVGFVRLRLANDATYKPEMVVVEDAQTVKVYGCMQPVYFDTPILGTASAATKGGFAFDRFMPVEQFVIGIQANFSSYGDRDAVVDAVAGIKSDDSMSYSDDGIAQTVSAKKGVSLQTTKKVPNPVNLMPYRTFPEIAQPESKFILRVTDKRGEPEVGLWEADGGAWIPSVMCRIRDWLYEQLEGTGICVLG